MRVTLLLLALSAAPSTDEFDSLTDRPPDLTVDGPQANCLAGLFASLSLDGGVGPQDSFVLWSDRGRCAVLHRKGGPGRVRKSQEFYLKDGKVVEVRVRSDLA